MENVKYRFIQNVGDYFPSGYFDEDFLDKIKSCAGSSSDDIKGYATPFTKLRAEYDKYKNNIVNQNCRRKDAIKYTHDFNTELLKVLGYETDNPYDRPFIVNDKDQEYIPVRHVLSHNGKVRMLVMEMQNMIQQPGEEEPAGLFNQRYNDEEGVEQVKNTQQRYRISDWEKVFTAPEGYKISPAIINKAISLLFLMPVERRPHFILMLAGNIVFLFDCDKWSRGAYLIFDLDELFSQASLSQNKGYYGLFYLLVAKNTLAADSEVVLMDTIIEDSYKKAYEVTQDLKTGVVTAVEELANEALYYMKNVAHKPFGKRRNDGTYDETDDSFETEIKDDCLTIVYRLLFIFYAESRSELGILPTNDEVYNKGYSLEMLRDLEQVRLVSQETRDGYFFDDSISKLFKLLAGGHNANEDSLHKSFKIRKVDSPLFDNGNLKHLGEVKIRNSVWQKIVCSLSLSKKNKKCGRISYANLGVNQLGSVYESLLAYRGFYAEEDYIEVYAAGNPEEGTFLVPYSRLTDFDFEKEVKKNENGELQILKKGSFVYRLNGRDRQKSASYYTPEVLTRSTVKYTLKSILDDVASGKRNAKDLLQLKILEPAMGAAAFQNEVINQLAEAYLNYQRIELEREGKLKKLIPPDEYQNELQKVKAYIATHNVYGVDLNPTAIELGKLSLWLNVIHKNMQPPFFSNRLALGNAVIGAWLKVYSKSDLNGSWWEKSPHKVKFGKKKVTRSKLEVYHFLLPDANMLGVRSIKEQKDTHQAEFKRMNDLAGDKQWTKKISPDDFERMVRISAKVDFLLKEHLAFQRSIENVTDNREEIWTGLDSEGGQITLDPYSTKAAMNAARYNKTSAYYRLKMVMDYWCALWFWEYDDARFLPTREQYWDDIEKMLNVPTELVQKQVEVSDEDSADIQLQSKEELLAGNAAGQTELNLQVPNNDTDKRFELVAKYAERYHFFHPMMEFIEVFWLNGGFDIICGNPPWIKLETDIIGVVSEKYPEEAIRNNKAPAVLKKAQTDYFVKNPVLKAIYDEENNNVAGSAVFLNSMCCYPLLKGQQTNLYKCILENSLEMLSPNGYSGLVHPETIYDDPNGQPLRKEVYHRLRYHFQYQNELLLFAEVHDEKTYSTNIYGSYQKDIVFESINNLFHPNTVDGCFVHDGNGKCAGIKEHKKWNVSPHSDRIVRYTKNELQILSKTFEDGLDAESTKLVNLHSKGFLDTLDTLSKFPTMVSEKENIVIECFHETNDVVDGNIAPIDNHVANINNYELIFKGSQIFVGDAFYKMPRAIVKVNSDYDFIDLTSIDGNFAPRTTFVPAGEINAFRALFPGFIVGQNADGTPKRDKWLDYYKLGFRKMLSQTGERTLVGAILPKKSSHINGIISMVFRDQNSLVEMAGLSSSIVLDFFIKTMNSANLTNSRMENFPLGVDSKYRAALYSRTLLLNCLSSHYAELWQDLYDSAFKEQSWSIEDSRLKPFASLSETWSWDTPLRNSFERRQALVEIDVICAMALGLTLTELEDLYQAQFYVLQDYEDETVYDAKGNVVFTTNKGIAGIGVERSVWKKIQGELSADELTYAGVGESYEFTVKKNKFYEGQTRAVFAPYTRCDRIADYRRAWAHFEKQFN